MIAATLAMVGCNKETPVNAGGEEVKGVFEIVAENGPETKATVDQDGAGVNVTRFIMEVYRKTANGDVLYNRMVQAASAGTGTVKTATFNMAFVKGQEYDVLFWADAANADKSDLYYNTASLMAVEMKGTYVGNDDKRDAFFKALTLTSTDTQASFTKTGVKLGRPFGQLNIITTDIDDIEALSGTLVLPTKVTVGYTAPSKFNVLTGEAGSDIAFTSVVTPYYNNSADHKALAVAAEKYTLSMDYIFAPKTGSSVKTVTLKVEDATSTLVNPTFENIPIQRNYRTNIIGDILTTVGTIQVETDPIWFTPEKNVTIQ